MSATGPAPAPSLALELGAYRDAVAARLAAWESGDLVARLWAGDHRLWTAEPAPELTDRLGWLHLPRTMADSVAELRELAELVIADGIEDVLLFGMGGSSLAPEVFQRVLGNAAGHPPLTVLDTTHPDAVAGVARSIDPARTFCVVSSKSGSTIETASLFCFFWSLVEGNFDRPGSRFAAITDPGSSLEELGRERGFRRVLRAPADVGGRYSALSPFGLAPAALIGADVGALLETARAMAALCADARPGDGANPGVELGAALGELALAGRDKLTFFTSERLASLPDWLEQLIAESTGKDGRGIVPVAGEAPGDPAGYGRDRVFAGLTLDGDDPGNLEELLATVAEAGHPTLRARLARPEDLGAEMFRWEMATAVASSVLGVHPFNQENVQLAKSLASKAMAGASDESAARVREVEAGSAALAGALGAWAASAGEGDYYALQAYLPPDPPVGRRLRELQSLLRRRSGLAATCGFGPRFLHSTGQLHKGGANNGVFLQLVNEPDTDLRVPERDYSFGRLIAAQADGDAAALLQTGRRLLRVRMGSDPVAGIDRVLEALADPA